MREWKIYRGRRRVHPVPSSAGIWGLGIPRVEFSTGFASFIRGGWVPWWWVCYLLNRQLEKFLESMTLGESRTNRKRTFQTQQPSLYSFDSFYKRILSFLRLYNPDTFPLISKLAIPISQGKWDMGMARILPWLSLERSPVLRDNDNFLQEITVYCPGRAQIKERP